MKQFYTFLIIFVFIAIQPAVLFAQDKDKDKKEKVVVVEKNLPEISVVDNVMYWKNVPVNKKIEIFTVYGTKVTDIEVKSLEGQCQLSLSKMIYIARVEGVVRKFVIK